MKTKEKKDKKGYKNSGALDRELKQKNDFFFQRSVEEMKFLPEIEKKESGKRNGIITGSVKMLIMFFAVTVLTNTVSAQTTVTERTLHRGELGLRYMPVFTALDFKKYNGDEVKGTVKMSNGFGLMLAFNFNRHIGLQLEGDYYQASQKFDDRNVNHKITLSYVNIPLLLTINTDKTMPVNFNVVVGPQFGANIGSDIKSTGQNGNGNGTSDTLTAVVRVKKGDMGVAYGAGFEFMLNKLHSLRLDLGYRGYYGLVNMNAKTTDNGTYNVMVKGARKTNGAYVGIAILF